MKFDIEDFWKICRENSCFVSLRRRFVYVYDNISTNST